MNRSFNFRIIIAVFCLVMAFPAVSAAAAKTAPPAAKKAAKADSPEELTKGLHEFGLKLAESYNRCVKGSKAKKDILQNADGSYTAVYHEIDPQSITGSYKDSSDPKGPVKYIGTLTYAEVKYTSTAPTKAEAEKGPFTESRSSTTELIKYVKGKWSY
ncbi:MAG: hypothetical protein FWG04_00180 [Desulfovibrionaceae bacterium]|nr:hypothetical protein [Desulfovibrionaceae bacterium]